MPYKTTKANFAYFKARAEYWQQELGLYDWHIGVFHGLETFPEGTSLGEYSANWQSHSGYVALAKDWGKDEITQAMLDEVAFHEMFHFANSRMIFLAEERCSSTFDIEEEGHALIRRMENLMRRRGEFGVPA